ncbi:pentatricopeptide repeat-containing protein, chloroplastic-like protein [Cinnamomum micranthum f. kanehirae]|uniref:Pentatricopeptide repeat-containing protein, chloroplastic-like protein n=1 Tax=Cinnamomum micranthum f. kanehirae TaxID=337451 RepID=A0A3S3P7R3_9MAGN|nr:pentatricopeptide repeat-containing protein, chloroplastic-like protein [Cinnamomum micranthum f. kanehirae]
MAIPATPSLPINSSIPPLQKCKTIPELQQIHAQIIKTGLIHHSFALSRQSGSGGFDHASSVFHWIQEPNPFAFFAIIKGFADSPIPLMSVTLYSQMLLCLEDLHGLQFSLPSVLKACGKALAYEEGRQIHAQVLKLSLLIDPFVSNSLLRMYLELGETRIARWVFERMPHRDIVSWNSLIVGYFKARETESARKLFEEMPEKDLVSWNSMLDGYVKCGKCDLAVEVFERMDQRDVVSWTTMISGFALNNHPNEAIELFKKMLGLGMRPDVAAIVSVLSAVADLGFVEEGKWIHEYVCRNKISLSFGFLGSALIDMYSKCGYIDNAYHVFRSISKRRRVGDWNSMISGLAIHGLGREALEIFHEMERTEIEHNEITFLGIMTACSHGGLVQEGRFYFTEFREKYHMVPKIQHYGCLIDLLGRAGHVEEAHGIIEEMPMEADVLAWKSLLSASVKHGHLGLGKHAALRAIELAPDDSSCYVLLSNIYAKAGRWADVAKTRLVMKERGVRKIPGCSTIIVDGRTHEFLVGKGMDLRYKEIVLSKLEEVMCRLKLEGYKPDLSQVLLDVEEEEKEGLLSLHSEKLAITFGLINTERGRPIHVVKNLRVCCDCHSFCKMVSFIYGHPIILRDSGRFHRFSNGSCSCNEYW